MKKKRHPDVQKPVYLTESFAELVEGASELAEIRKEYVSASPEHRARSAGWEYEASMADYLFSQALTRAGQEGLDHPEWPSGYVALAIDPDYAPALLTVGSIEYQLGRVREAMKLFARLLVLPKKTDDLLAIIAKAGDFLICEGDFTHGQTFYADACRCFPDVAVLYSGLGYCCGKLGALKEAIAAHRRAVELEPRSHLWLNDLGFSFMQAGEYAEALPALEAAARLSPPEYELARNNLADLREIMARR